MNPNLNHLNLVNLTRLQTICQTHHMQLAEHISLAQHTTFRIGGSARFWIEVCSTEGLGEILKFCHETQTAYFVMGRGSNILASDQGYSGLILHLGSDFAGIRQQGDCLICEAGAMLSNIAKFALEHSLSGMEALSGIPGTIGGALFMNAGAYGSEMKDIVTACRYLDESGAEHVLMAQELDLAYRHSFFTEHAHTVITSVIIQLTPGDPEEIISKSADYARKRKTKQPLNYPSAGSTFKRPQGSYASQLIDECGLKGDSVGGAQVSEKHAGFVINTGNATCEDVLALCRHVRDVVAEKTGYLLELEPVLLGDPETQEDCSCS